MTSPDSNTSTLARLCFQVPSERMAEFEAAYESQLVPLLKKHDLEEASERGRPTIDGVFSRLCAVAAPSDIEQISESLAADREWISILTDLGTSYQTSTSDEPLAHSFGLYSTSAPPRIVEEEDDRWRGHWRHYSSGDGIAAGPALSLMLDSRGQLWCGTQSGVSRFDGQSWTDLTSKGEGPSRDQLVVFEDRQGQVWSGGGHGLACYDGGEWTTYTTDDGLADNTVSSILQDRHGNLWVGTGNFFNKGRGVSRYDGHNWTTFTAEDGLANDTVLSILEDRRGDLWFGTGGGLSRYDGQSWTTFTVEDGLPSNRLFALLEDEDGSLWIGSDAGICRYDGQRWTTFDSDFASAGQGSSTSTVYALFRDRDGNIWAGSLGDGVYCYDGDSWTRPEHGRGWNVTSIAQDEHGRMWFTTHGSGVWCYDSRTWTTFRAGDRLPRLTCMLRHRDGSFWFGSANHGVGRFDGQTWSLFSTENGLPNNAVWSMAQDHERRVWVSTLAGGVCCYDGRSWTTFTIEDGLPNNRIPSSLADRDGCLWFGAEFEEGGGVCRYDGDSWMTLTSEDGLLESRVKWVMQDRNGHFWFGTWAGVSRYDGESWTNFTLEDGLPSESVESIYEDAQDRIWVATSTGGVGCYDGQSWTNLTTEDGLPENFTTTVFQDRRGHFWFGTIGSGVCRYDGQIIQTIDQEDGLAGNVVWWIYQDEEDRMWFTTENGVSCYTAVEHEPPSVSIRAVAADRRYEQLDELVLPSTASLVAIEFDGASWSTRPLVYRYRLKDRDTDWRTTRAHRAEYENLRPGTHTFEVQAVDQNLAYSPLASVTFKLRDPQQERIEELEMRVQERTRELEEKNRALEEANRFKSEFLASMSHDLRTPMNAIIGYTRILLRRAKDALDDRQYLNLENIQTSADNLLILINNILDLSKIEAGRIDITPEDVDLRQLVSNCVTSVLVKPAVRLEEQIEETGSVHTDADLLRKVVMNVMGNASKFTERGSITVSAKPVDGWIELSVADTGPGITADDLPHVFDEFRQVDREGGAGQEGTGLGLSIAKKSIELLGGSISAESEVGAGTTFTLRIRDYPPETG